MYSLSQSIKFNYHHLTKKFYDPKFQTDLANNFKNRFLSRRSYNCKLFIIPTCIIMLLCCVLIVIPFTRCALKTTIYAYYKVDVDICLGEPLTTEHYLVGGISTNIYLMLEVFVMLTFIALTLRYPIQNDKFFLKKEFIALFVTWYGAHNLFKGIIHLFNIDLNVTSILLINSIRNILLSLIYGVVTLLRRNINNEEIKAIMKDFDSFMYCHVYYSFFKEYIIKYHEDDYKLLSFWIEYNIFKKQYAGFRKQGTSVKVCEGIPLQEQMKMSLLEDAEMIYTTYFLANKTQSHDNINNLNLFIDFPVDIAEKVEEGYRKGLDIEKPEEIFDEAFQFVHNKLYNIFLLFCRNTEEYEKLERMMFFIDFYEIKRVISNSNNN
jgi:hypothetical protein